MAAGCKEHPEWLHHSLEIADRCNFEFPFGAPQFPAFVPPDGLTAKEYLYRWCCAACFERYGSRAQQFEPQVREELGIIADVGYEDYFLITWDILQECRRRGIEWITRGSAADSSGLLLPRD
jgi:DNA polymerase III alpha subunit